MLLVGAHEAPSGHPLPRRLLFLVRCHTVRALPSQALHPVFYVANYATKMEDPVWKRAAPAAELFHVLDKVAAKETQAEEAHQYRHRPSQRTTGVVIEQGSS